MAAKKGSGFASRTQPNAAQKQGSPRIGKSPPHPQKPRVAPPPKPKQIPHPRSAKAADRVRDDTPREQRKWERTVEKKKEKRRSRYRAVQGKVVEWVDHWIEDAYVFVSIRFKDQTDLRLQFGAKMVTDEIYLSDVRGGGFRLVRQYFRRPRV